jgi:hypothetical protein
MIVVAESVNVTVETEVDLSFENIFVRFTTRQADSMLN